MTTSGHATDDTDARTGQKGYLMDTVDITLTPEACRQIARLFRARQADAEALYEAEGARALKMREGVEALGPYAATDGEGSADAA